MSISHTPGPVWSFRYYMDPVGKNEDNFHLFNGSEGDEGSTVLEGAFTFPGTHSEALAFARLIAAAPELLAALEAITRVRVQGHDNIWAGANRCREIAAAAIAKATSRQPEGER